MPVSVLVTGGCGFVGQLIVDALQEQHPDWTITVLDLQTPDDKRRQGVTYIQGSILDCDLVEQTLLSSRPHAIIHNAGFVPAPKDRFDRRLERKTLEINVRGTEIMLAACQKLRRQQVTSASLNQADTTAFVWTGSCTAVIEKFGPAYRNIDESFPVFATHSLIYGESKARAEHAVLAANDPAAGLLTCALRPSVLFGEHDYQLIPTIHALIRKRETAFVIGPGDNLWDVSYAPNIADAHILAVENLLGLVNQANTNTLRHEYHRHTIIPRSAAGEAIFIQNNEPIPFRAFCLAIWAHFSHYPPFAIHIPEPLAWALGLLAEMLTWVLGTYATLSRGSVRDASAWRYASGRKAERLLGYRARVGLDEGLRRSCVAYRERLAREEQRGREDRKDRKEK